MKKGIGLQAFLRSALAALLLSVVAASCANTNTAQNEAAPSAIGSAMPSSLSATPQDHLAGIGSATIITIHGTILSVNRQTGLVTLQGPNGKTATVHVYDPYNLAAAKPGEPFVARFYEVVTIRKKQPGESVPPASLQQGIVGAMPGQSPGGAIGSQFQMVATIVAIDREKNTAEIRGPDGVTETVDVDHPETLAYVKAGDEIVITLTNVVAFALVKENPA